MKPQAPEAFAAFVGLDWAEAKHDICLQAAGTARREFLCLEHRPEAIDAWVQSLHTRFNGQPVAVCLELNKGPIVSALCTYDFLVLFPVNPLTVAKYREAFTPSRAKDDPTDAELQVELLLTHRDKLTALSPQSPTMRALAQLVEHRRRLVGDKVRLTNRLTSALKNYFPQVLQWWHWFSLMGICFPFPMNRLCHLHVENFTHRQPPFDHAQSDSGDFSGRKMDAKKIVDHPIDM